VKVSHGENESHEKYKKVDDIIGTRIKKQVDNIIAIRTRKSMDKIIAM